MTHVVLDIRVSAILEQKFHKSGPVFEYGVDERRRAISLLEERTSKKRREKERYWGVKSVKREREEEVNNENDERSRNFNLTHRANFYASALCKWTFLLLIMQEFTHLFRVRCATNGEFISTYVCFDVSICACFQENFRNVDVAFVAGFEEQTVAVLQQKCEWVRRRWACKRLSRKSRHEINWLRHEEVIGALWNNQRTS